MSEDNSGAVLFVVFVCGAILFAGYAAGASVTQNELVRCERKLLSNAQCSELQSWAFYSSNPAKPGSR